MITKSPFQIDYTKMTSADKHTIYIIVIYQLYLFITLGPRHNGRHFSDDIVKCIFLNENIWIPIKISLTFVPRGPMNNIPALV